MRFLSRLATGAAVAGLAGGLVGIVPPAAAEPAPLAPAAAAPAPLPPAAAAPAPPAPAAVTGAVTGAERITPGAVLRGPAEARPAEASLVVRLRKGAGRAGVVARLDREPGIEVLGSDVVPGAGTVTVEVPAGDASAALAALAGDADVSAAEPDRVRYATAVTADDPFRPDQWGVDRIGADAAWQRSTGAADVTVAVLDTGVTPNPELAGRLLPGYNAITGSAVTTDDHGHGTQVATVVAAAGNDAYGMAGACWSCTILPVKVLDAEGSGYDSDIVAGIRWAADKGADIINLSLGGLGGSSVLDAAVAYATGKGVLVVAAAGNENTTLPTYPAASAGVLAVAGSTVTDARYPWSNHGGWADVAAPGVNVARAHNGGYYWFGGTSSASPLVAGIAALLLAAHPTATPQDLTQALTATAAPVPGSYVSAGRVDAGKAMARLDADHAYTAPGVALTSPGPGTVLQGASVPVGVALSGPPATTVEAVFKGRLVASGPAGAALSWNTTASRSGPGALTLVATGADGHVATADTRLTVDNVKPAVGNAAPGHAARVRGTVTVTATGVTDLGTGVGHLSLYADGTYVGQDRTAPYAVRFATGRRNGWVRLQWRAYDRAGHTGTYDRRVIADNTAPAVAITRGPRNGARVRGTVRLTVKATDTYGIARVELLVNGRRVATDRRAPHTFSVATGKYGRTIRVQARAYDVAGNARHTATRTWRR
jgi:subtilisin family serine protease